MDYRLRWHSHTHTHTNTPVNTAVHARVNPLAQSAQNGQRFELMWQCKHLTRSDPEVERRWLKRCHTLQGRRFAAGRLARLAKLSSSQLARQDSGTPSSTYTHTHARTHCYPSLLFRHVCAALKVLSFHPLSEKVGARAETLLHVRHPKQGGKYLGENGTHWRTHTHTHTRRYVDGTRKS